ncbi:MAG: NADH-quinone oxidoreductase subunit C [Chloroflexota bacterium]|nr:NADH-quinone oxidoreductase subunit C [Chloroflexota bacterium]
MDNEIISAIESKFPKEVLSSASEDKKILLTVKEIKFHQILSNLKDMGFDHLSDVALVDYINEGEFELIYHLWSHSKKIRAIVKTRIPRESPRIKSIIDLWIGAQIHEREGHEMFGVEFEGNPNLTPLFLEDWEELPPFRKDFDIREYVKREYYGEDKGYFG